MKHVLIVSLHRSSVVSFDKHLDHEAHLVTYVTDAVGAQAVARYRSKVADMIVVDHPDDVERACAAAREIEGRVGQVDVVIAPAEYDLLTAARIRDRLGVAGMTEAETLVFRDKVCMKQRLRAYGVPTPRFAECRSRPEVVRLVRQLGYPLVLKPRQGAGSRGVVVVEDALAMERAWTTIDPETYECEEFVPGPICHVDGLIQKGRLTFGMASRYVNTCLQSAQGLPHGSVMVDDPDLRRELMAFALRSVEALGLDDSAFHLEVILRDGSTPVFLEVGARLGGGEIKPLVQDLYGVDLLREWIDVQLGTGHLRRGGGAVGGWLVVPPPCEPPYEVVEASALSGQIPHLYHEAMPRPGEVFDKMMARQDKWTGGRFRYKGPSTAEVERAINETMQRYRLRVERGRSPEASLATGGPADARR
ncbi:ATP-grasp domain-containing protein [Sorangium sp. So ce1097]|uniref:ATP-grasp domain-containing protein n=1 Tax=Sorangium sp. So ce1097 TaxID=3133330 RepID=UPI003F5E0EBC